MFLLFYYYKNLITTIPSYKEIHLLKQDSLKSGGNSIGRLLYRAIDNGQVLYEGRFFYINADSSNTIGEIRTTNLDSTTALKEITNVLNTISLAKTKN